MKAAAALLAAAVLSTGCGLTQSVAPLCETESTLVLMAQSTPTATLLPCLDELPDGWQLGEMDIDSESARFWLDSDRGGEDAVAVVLEEQCDPGDAELESDAGAEIERYAAARTTPDAYTADWYDRFGGGCVHYVVDVRSQAWPQLVEEIDRALTFVSREDLAQRVRDATRGGIDLGPAAS